MVKPKVLVCGAESSGTKLLTSLLRQAGADAVHSSPNYRREQGKFPHMGWDFDAVCIVVRNWFPHMKSMTDNRHAMGTAHAREMTYDGLFDILYGLRYGLPEDVYFVTYESLVYEPYSIHYLLMELGLDEEAELDEIGNANAKYYGGEHFRDQRELEERR